MLIKKRSSGLQNKYNCSNEMVLRPGFEPGSTAREAVILDRTILPELGILQHRLP
jgi:hypothetical protein